ncbi:hypothetical protein TRVL_08327 [Trypanosoma vivax]|nr:hypothetical protein TRVL_08327 [Trypanosoma vivax]
MERAGVILEASQKSTMGLVVSFTVVEGKPSELRRRFVARSKGETDHDDCEAEAPQQRASRCLDAAFGGVETVFDLKASFFQVSLLQGSYTSFRRCTETGRLLELTRFPTGYKCTP